MPRTAAPRAASPHMRVPARHGKRAATRHRNRQWQRPFATRVACVLLEYVTFAENARAERVVKARRWVRSEHRAGRRCRTAREEMPSRREAELQPRNLRHAPTPPSAAVRRRAARIEGRNSGSLRPGPWQQARPGARSAPASVREPPAANASEAAARRVVPRAQMKKRISRRRDIRVQTRELHRTR